MNISMYHNFCFFFRSPRGLESGRLTTPFRKCVSSRFSKQINNPNPSPNGRMAGFGLYWFGAESGTRTRTPRGQEILSLRRLPFRHSSKTIAIMAQNSSKVKPKRLPRSSAGRAQVKPKHNHPTRATLLRTTSLTDMVTRRAASWTCSMWEMSMLAACTPRCVTS